MTHMQARPGTAKPVAEGLIALMLILFLLFVAGPKLVTPPHVDPDHPFDTQATFERIDRILGDETPHPADSAASDGVIQRLTSEIRQLGFAPIIDDAFHCNQRWRVSCARVRNIGFWVSEPGPDAVMIASHHDSVPTGPGAADDMMGVAASLEIARIMADQDMARPLYVLITDAEEIGLVGASRFVRHDPVAPMIGAVVSLEARGNQGIANMFETSAPNGRDLAALARLPGNWLKGPTSNSLAVDIYRAMPNGTDVTEYLELDMDAANYAMVGRPSHYHTPLDDLAHLDPDAVFHIGASALSAVNGLMGVNADTPDRPKIYSDVLGLGVIALPAAFGLPLIGIGLLLCGVALFRTGRRAALWRVLLVPLAALIVGGGLAFAIGWGVGAVRPEPNYGTAYPVALRGALLAAALLGAALIARWLYRPAGADRYLAGAWTILLALGLAATLAFPGAAVIFAFPALFVIPAALFLIAKQGFVARLLFSGSSLLLLALLLPLHAMAETALFIEGSAPLTLVMLFVFITALPLMWRTNGAARRPLIGTAIALIGFVAAALVVPAYSEELPRGMNILHLDSDRMEDAVFTIGTRGPVPDGMRDAAPFTQGDLPGFGGPYWATPAPRVGSDGVSVVTLQNELRDDGRFVVLGLSSRDADRVRLYADDDSSSVSAVAMGSQILDVEDGRFPSIECVGRTCRRMQIAVLLDDPEASLDLVLSQTQYGLDETAAALIASRPDWAVPQHRGDRRVKRRHVSLSFTE